MKIVLPSAEIITEENPLKRIELAGRVCYKSEDKITESSAAPFVKRLIERGHLSPLEHARILIPEKYQGTLRVIGRAPYGLSKRIRYVPPCPCIHGEGDDLVINARDYLAVGGSPDILLDDTFENASDYLTVRFTCDRAIANELVRHRVFSFCQESTRYVCYSGEIEFVLPVPFAHYGHDGYAELLWRRACKRSEESYHELLYAGASPQEARNVLPLSLKTELVMTGTHDQWKEMLKLRLSPKAHPQMRYLMKKLVELPGFPLEDIEVPKWQPELGMEGGSK